MIKRFGGNNYNFVVAVAGQSNAVGYDESPVDEKFSYNSVDSTRIKQLGFYGDENLKLVDLGHCAQNVQDMRVFNDVNGVVGTKGLHLPLANLMLDCIPQDYGVIVIPVAYGSTGFNSGNEGKYDEVNKKPANIANGMKWSATSALYLTLRDRIKHVLDLNPHNIFAGVVWLQGENDQGNANNHKAGFEAMTQALFDYMNNNGYGNRVPSGVWDKDIWYNVETVTHWDFQGQCKTIWDNYKAWNKNTYVKIPRDTESNLVNGTGDTSSTLASHYGNNAFYKVIAPRVVQKMIDNGTFGKRFTLVDNSKDDEVYINSLPEQKLVTATDAVIQKTSDSFTITVADGECDISQDLTAQTYAQQKPLVYFGEVYKMEWKVTKGIYWLVIEGDDISDCVVLGLGSENTHQIARLKTSGLQVIVKGATKYPNDRYNFQLNDRVRVYRNKDNTVSVYRTDAGNGVFQKWFDCEVPNYCSAKGFGFTFGIGVNEINSPFDTNKTKIFSELKIQDKEYQVTNKLLDVVVGDFERRLTALETAQTP